MRGMTKGESATAEGGSLTGSWVMQWATPVQADCAHFSCNISVHFTCRRFYLHSGRRGSIQTVHVRHVHHRDAAAQQLSHDHRCQPQRPACRSSAPARRRSAAMVKRDISCTSSQTARLGTGMLHSAADKPLRDRQRNLGCSIIQV